MANEDDELKALIAEEEGKIANAAADSCLQLLAVLGAMRGEATLEYRAEVGSSLVVVMLALASVRMCIEAASAELTEGQRVLRLARLVGGAFDIDPDQIMARLLDRAG